MYPSTIHNDVNRWKALDIKKIFAVFGQFVTLTLGQTTVELRPVLELIRKDCVPDHPDAIGRMVPDLLVIMMNPGSSRPLSPHYRPRHANKPEDLDPFSGLTPTRPDNTQYQIMRVMLARGLGHARVLNLSDLRETKSPIFIKRFRELENLPGGKAHSLFSPSRCAEREQRMGQGRAIPLLVGWGRHVDLLPLAHQCLGTLKTERIVGVEVPGSPGLYAHPSPMLQKAKEAWVNAILEKMPP
ncbi:MAG: DUF1643 protein [Magnetococcales bacterium]|nr:DUF1643 protein [Magnetococcales bacterium]HIJ85425.1 DUF1643 domain-containing protein [Magnetococcales bacterium]